MQNYRIHHLQVKIENLGVVQKAEIDLGNLTIIAIENSIGKINIAYTIWNILRNTDEYLKVNSYNNFITTWLNNPEELFYDNIQQKGLIKQKNYYTSPH